MNEWNEIKNKKKVKKQQSKRKAEIYKNQDDIIWLNVKRIGYF